MNQTIIRSVLTALIISLSALTAGAQHLAALEQGSLSTVGGLGGSARLVLPFSEGDKVRIDFRAHKQLERAIAYVAGTRIELAKVRSSKKGFIEIIMPRDGNVIIEFVNARGGGNEISYQLSGISNLTVWQEKIRQASIAAAAKGGDQPPLPATIKTIN